MVFPESEADGEFVYHMGDVLDVYCQPYDPAVPRICMDAHGQESGQRQVSSRTSEAGTSCTRRLHPTRKEGRANLFIAYEPLAGKRCLKVTEHRTKKDWAIFVRGGC